MGIITDGRKSGGTGFPVNFRLFREYTACQNPSNGNFSSNSVVCVCWQLPVLDAKGNPSCDIFPATADFIREMTGCRIILRNSRHITASDVPCLRGCNTGKFFFCAKCDDGGGIIWNVCLGESVWGSCHFPHNSILLWRHFRQGFFASLFSFVWAFLGRRKRKWKSKQCGMKRSIFGAVHTHNALAEKKIQWWMLMEKALRRSFKKMETKLSGL